MISKAIFYSVFFALVQAFNSIILSDFFLVFMKFFGFTLFDISHSHHSHRHNLYLYYFKNNLKVKLAYLFMVQNYVLTYVYILHWLNENETS